MDDAPLDAGDFGTWLHGIQRALAGGAGTDVDCDTCTACCTASQFVHIAPDEVETLAHIPRELLHPAPLLPRGQMVLGHDAEGRCPMLGDHGCTIYEHRPRTCRTYDCRVFAAAHVDPDDELIAARARRWRFQVATDADGVHMRAIERAAARLDALDDEADDGVVPSSPTQRAVLAVELHGHFVARDRHTDALTATDPSDDELLAATEHWSPVR